MNAISLLSQSFEDLHRELRGDMAEVRPEMLFWQPAAGVNHIGFLFWHLVRDEDTMIADLTGQPQVWEAGDWAPRLGLEMIGRVATLSPEDAGRLRYEFSRFLEYAEQVWLRTLEAVPAFTESRLDTETWPGWNLARSLVEGSIGHGWLHLGEIRYAMGLQGWRFRE